MPIRIVNQADPSVIFGITGGFLEGARKQADNGSDRDYAAGEIPFSYHQQVSYKAMDLDPVNVKTWNMSGSITLEGETLTFTETGIQTGSVRAITSSGTTNTNTLSPPRREDYLHAPRQGGFGAETECTLTEAEPSYYLENGQKEYSAEGVYGTMSLSAPVFSLWADTSGDMFIDMGIGFVFEITTIAEFTITDPDGIDDPYSVWRKNSHALIEAAATDSGVLRFSNTDATVNGMGSGGAVIESSTFDEDGVETLDTNGSNPTFSATVTPASSWTQWD